MNTTQQCIDAYKRHQNLKLAAREINLPWQTVYVHLRKAGVPVTGNKRLYGTESDKFAANAEAEFLRLVPVAVDQNKIKFQAKFDFQVGPYKVDVKASHAKHSYAKSKTKRWAFSSKKQEFIADFLVCFGYLDDGDHKLFLIPGDLIRTYQSISISCSGRSKWNEFEITPAGLADFFVQLLSETSPEPSHE